MEIQTPSRNLLEADIFVTTKRQFEQVFLPASRHTTPSRRSSYVTLFAVRHRRDIDFDSARARSIQTGKNNIFIEYADANEAVIVGYYAKNLKDLRIYERRVGNRQRAFFAQGDIFIEFHAGRRKL